MKCSHLGSLGRGVTHGPPKMKIATASAEGPCTHSGLMAKVSSSQSRPLFPFLRLRFPSKPLNPRRAPSLFLGYSWDSIYKAWSHRVPFWHCLSCASVRVESDYSLHIREKQSFRKKITVFSPRLEGSGCRQKLPCRFVALRIACLAELGFTLKPSTPNPKP